MPKTSRKELIESEIASILALYHAGISQRRIASQLAIPRSTVQYNIHRFKNQPQGPYLTKSRSGRPAILNEREERHLI
jgi:transposase